MTQTVETETAESGHGAPPMPSGWQPIEGAPMDGTPVVTGLSRRGFIPVYPVASRFIEGRWKFEVAGEWHSYDPQPNVWNPALQLDAGRR